MIEGFNTTSGPTKHSILWENEGSEGRRVGKEIGEQVRGWRGEND
jgi:hypothetical protein